MNPKELPAQRTLHRAVRGLMRYFKSTSGVPQERRRQTRTLFVHPLTVLTADRRRLQCVSRDLSLNGMRILGSESLVGQTVGITIARRDGEAEQWYFTLQVLWSSAIGDGLVDSGGLFLGVAQPER